MRNPLDHFQVKFECEMLRYVNYKLEIKNVSRKKKNQRNSANLSNLYQVSFVKPQWGIKRKIYWSDRKNLFLYIGAKKYKKNFFDITEKSKINRVHYRYLSINARNWERFIGLGQLSDNLMKFSWQLTALLMGNPKYCNKCFSPPL